MQTIVNLLGVREKKKDKNASLTSHIMLGVKVPLLKFLKLAHPTFKEVDNFKEPQQFSDAMWCRCEAMGCTNHHAMTLTSLRLEGEVNWYEFRRSERAANSPLIS